MILYPITQKDTSIQKYPRLFFRIWLFLWSYFHVAFMYMYFYSFYRNWFFQQNLKVIFVYMFYARFVKLNIN